VLHIYIYIYIYIYDISHLRVKFTVVPHPPYSPDLAPSDFWLFPKLKEMLKGQHF